MRKSLPSKRELAQGHFTREKLASWGIPWPPPKGWRKKLEREIYVESLYVRRGWHPEPEPEPPEPDPMPLLERAPSAPRVPVDSKRMDRYEKIAIGQSRLKDIE